MVHMAQGMQATHIWRTATNSVMAQQHYLVDMNIPRDESRQVWRLPDSTME